MYQGQPQQPLPGAYYGPAVPPPQQSKSRDCFCCLFSTAIRIFIGVMILLGILALVLWLVLRPNEIKVYVTTASLTQFNLTTPGNNLQYNLSTVVTIRNPNKRVGLYYDYLEATADYEGERFDRTTLPSFYQGHKNTTTLYPAFSGRSVIDLSSSDVRDFELQRQAGTFDVKLRLWGRIRFKIGSSFKTSRTTLKIKCSLAIPYGANGRTFSETKCDVGW